MRNRKSGSSRPSLWRACGGLLVAVGLLSEAATAQPSDIPKYVNGRLPQAPEVLKKFLQSHLRQIDPKIDETTKFSYAFVDLDGDGKAEAIVHMTGRSWCGTGGCNTYILTPNAGTYKFVGRIPATRPPIRVLDKISHGWHSVTTVVRDDATHIYEGELRFNGQKYPLGERPPAERLPGKVVISEGQQEFSLFP
jgi:hypothetical protein